MRICFVCLGNICRSPTAAGVMRHLVAEAGLEGRIEIESAGTGSWHVGSPPDPRAVSEATGRGIELEGQARQFRSGDFARFDMVIAMDRDNEAALRSLAPDSAAESKIHLLREFDPGARGDLSVPDPYYGGHDGFARVFDLVELACRGLLAELRAELPAGG